MLSELAIWLFSRLWIVSWQVLLVAVFIYIIAKYFRVPAKIIYVLYCLLLLRLCFPLHYTFTTQEIPDNIAFPVVSKVVLLDSAPQRIVQPSMQETPINPSIDSTTLFMHLWFVIVCIAIFMLFLRIVRYYYKPYPKVMRQGIIDCLQDLCQQMQILCPVHLAISDKGPCIWGLRTKTILLPEIVVREWDIQDIRPILIHELNHIRQGDLWINLGQNFLQIIYFFHPLVWLLNSEIRKWREFACDERCTAWVSKKHYCEIMLKIATYNLRTPSVFWEPALFQKQTLLQKRIQMMLSPNKNFTKARILILACIFLVTSTLIAQNQALIKQRYPLKDIFVFEDYSQIGWKQQKLQEILMSIPGVDSVGHTEDYIEIFCTKSSVPAIEKFFADYSQASYYKIQAYFIETPKKNSTNNQVLKFHSLPKEQNLKQLLQNQKIISAPRLIVGHGQGSNITIQNQHSYVSKYTQTIHKNGDWVADPVIDTIHDGIKLEVCIIKNNNSFCAKIALQISELHGFSDKKQYLTSEPEDYAVFQEPDLQTADYEEEIIIDSLPHVLELSLPLRDKSLKIFVSMENYQDIENQKK